MIFAAGQGTRLRPLTDLTPKALVEIGGMTLLERTIERLAHAGCDRIVVNLHHMAGRIADFLEFADVMAVDALDRAESCGGHFREESQTKENEALRNDEKFSYSSAWEFQGVGKAPTLHKEPLVFENVKLTQRSYK